MINSVAFYNFRGLKHLELSELSQITLLTGRNNAGKSSVLEGIFLLMDHSAAESFGKINNFRGIYVRMDPGSL
ncbi:MAG: AAA family ATPase, partial [Oscillospiraceae bacterium]|nr:AAA family ATPase [Oscillospiraceae bacterium]